MTDAFARMRPQLSLWFCLIFWPAVALATPTTFQGLLIPASFDPPIPITVTMDDSYGNIKGRVKTSVPLVGEGPITSGRKERSICHLTSQIGSGVRLSLEGNCVADTMAGRYRVHFPDNRRVDGTFRLHAVASDKAAKKGWAEETAPAVPATRATCLRANSACLTACPRGGDNSEFLCANACTRKYAACKRTVTESLEQP